jgi:hypothetical protein
MRIESTTNPVKSHRGKILGYKAHYRNLGTYPEEPTKAEAEAKLAPMVQFRCEQESASVKVVALRGYVCVFTYSLEGWVETRMVQAGFEGTLQSSSSSQQTIAEAVDSFRYHVAQLTWDGSLNIPNYVPEAKHREFQAWAEFQLRYKTATNQGMTDGAAREWACDHLNPYEAGPSDPSTSEN